MMASIKPQASFTATHRGTATSMALCFGLLLLAVIPVEAQFCHDSTISGTLIGLTPGATGENVPNVCNLLPCHEPRQNGAPRTELIPPDCDGDERSCSVRVTVPLVFPGNHQMATNNHARIFWFGEGTPPPATCLPPPQGNCRPISFCGGLGSEFLVDFVETWIQVGTSCQDIARRAANPNGRFRTYSVSGYACLGFLQDCTERVDVSDLKLDPETLWSQLKCDGPPPRQCDDCTMCPVGGASVGTGPPEIAPAGLGPVPLRYKGRSVGHPDFPGSATWNVTLGRYWSHDFAERIVIDPDTGDDSHVWLLTRHAAFVEFRNLDAGVYRKVLPSDDYRTLRRTASGWELEDLDGTVTRFDAAGRWSETRDRSGNTAAGSYGAEGLTGVTFPDGRRAAFAYHPDGKLASVTEVGVGGADSRTWSYTWSGLDLVCADRPDGTAWAFAYGDPRHPGSLTRMTLIGTDGGQRVERAWEYDGRSNVIRTWKGDTSPTGPDAVELYQLAFDSPFRPETTRVTDPLGNVATYTIEREPGGVKGRVARIDGDCPICDLGPNTQLFYDDFNNPLLPTRAVDARGTVTHFEYDAHGQIISRTEAVGTALERTTTWKYEGPFPRLATAIEEPSTSGSGLHRTSWVYDEAGNAISRIEEGIENGLPFSFESITAFNAAGQPLYVDPPGFDTQDRTSFTYDPNRGNLLVATRTDPLIGSRVLEYDSFNRPTRITDQNGFAAETTYDKLNRVLKETLKGATAAADRVTERTYTPFGDLHRIIHPEGNILEHSYDAAGRLISVETKPDPATPGERIRYTLTATGQHAREEIQSWDGSGWQTESFIEFVYRTQCHLDKVLHANGSVTELAYDCQGNVEKEWDANHPSNNQQNPPSRRFAYDRLNRLQSITEPFGGVGGGETTTRFEYDVQDHQTTVIDGNGTATRFVYSDRGLLTEEVSEVSGRTSYAYNDHGQIVHQTNARGVTVERTVDALDRVTFVNYPEDDLDTLFIYDDPLVPFSKGRLTSIDRDVVSIDYRYDIFGRLIQDGALTYGYDKNGNRTTIAYPNGITASYTYDFVGRETSLSIQDGQAAPQPIVDSAAYRPAGPLEELVLGNGLRESRAFNSEYFPQSIDIPGKMSLVYTTDALGNITGIENRTVPDLSQSYTYQDYQYFLSGGDGLWGDLAWAYDRGGNRLTETRNGVVTNYVYKSNAAGRDTSSLVATVTEGLTIQYESDSAGNLVRLLGDGFKVRYRYNGENRLSQIRSDNVDSSVSAVVAMQYDGRGFLRSAALTPETGHGVDDWITWITYGSEGQLYHRVVERYPTTGSARGTPRVTGEDFVFYFAGRPVAQLVKRELSVADELPVASTSLMFLSTDHLGTPLLVTDDEGAVVWSGGFEPFGMDFLNALEAGVFVRFPGQWEDETWIGASPGSGLHYNLNRWYQPETGRYTRPDPIGLQGALNVYQYALARPINVFDPDGLRGKIAVCCNPLVSPLGAFKHCYIRRVDLDTNDTTTVGLHTNQSVLNFIIASTDFSIGKVKCNQPFDRGGKESDCTFVFDPCDDLWECAKKASKNYPPVSFYRTLRPNSNTFAGTVARQCGLALPPDLGPGDFFAPGFNDNPAWGVPRWLVKPDPKDLQCLQ